jgi:hypothetical protein
MCTLWYNCKLFRLIHLCTYKKKLSLAPAPREPHLLEGKAVMASKTKYLHFNTMQQPVIVTHGNTSTTTHLQAEHQHMHRAAQEV